MFLKLTELPQLMNERIDALAPRRAPARTLQALPKRA
jgi:hypothetical protein